LYDNIADTERDEEVATLEVLYEEEGEFVSVAAGAAPVRRDSTRVDGERSVLVTLGASRWWWGRRERALLLLRSHVTGK
jgi:hypothetical protein